MYERINHDELFYYVNQIILASEKSYYKFHILFRGSYIGYVPVIQPHRIVSLSRYRIKFKSLICKRTITKNFSFYEKHVLDFTNTFCFTISFSIVSISFKWLISFNSNRWYKLLVLVVPSFFHNFHCGGTIFFWPIVFLMKFENITQIR